MSTALDDFCRAALTLRALLAEAGDAQWKPSHTPRPRDDTDERSKGGHGDPTLATVVDDRRLALRAAVIEAEGAFDEAALRMSDAGRKVQRALDRWAGALPTDE